MIEVAAAVVVGCGAYLALMTYLRERSGRPDPALDAVLRRRLEPLPTGVSLSVARLTGPDENGETRITIGGLCPNLTLAFDPKGAGPHDADALDFVDPRIRAHGRRPLACAVLGQAARAAFLELAATEGVRPERLLMSNGALSLDVDQRTARHLDAIEGVTRGALAAARLLRLPPDVPARLAENVAADASVSFRLACLKTLLDDYAGYPSTQAGLRAAAASAVPGLQLVAGRALGESGRAVLLALLRRPEIDDSAFSAAVDALRVIPPELAADLLARSLAHTGPGIAGSLTARSVIEALRRAHGGGAASLADAVRSPAEEVALEAIGLLGDEGTIDAVPLLEDVAAHHHSAAVRRRAHAAVADVQSRQKGAAPGQVSLSGDQAGEVTLADDAAGRLSVPPAGPERA